MGTDSETPKPETRSAPLDPFEIWRAARDASLESLRSMRDAGLKSWSKIMIDFVNSEAYSQATAQWLDTYLTISQPFQRVIETTMTQVLTGLNMPTRADVTSLAARLTNIEIRLDDLDAKLDDIQRAVQTLSALKDDIQRAVQALSASKDAADTSGTDSGGAGSPRRAGTRLPTPPTLPSPTPPDSSPATTSQPERKTTTATSGGRSRLSIQQSGGKQGKAKGAH